METCFFFFFFFCMMYVCIAAQPIEDQASRLVIPQDDQSPGSSTGSMSGNCEYDRNKKSYDNGKINIIIINIEVKIILKK